MHTNITKQFVEAVEKYGTKTAVVDYPDGNTQHRTSFDELMRRSRQVAAHIQGKGIASHSFVTIELPAGADFLAAEMGVWLACCVAVPSRLFPSLPSVAIADKAAGIFWCRRPARDCSVSVSSGR